MKRTYFSVHEGLQQGGCEVRGYDDAGGICCDMGTLQTVGELVLESAGIDLFQIHCRLQARSSRWGILAFIKNPGAP